jgi:hypothetical protein
MLNINISSSLGLVVLNIFGVIVFLYQIVAVIN